MRTGEDLDPAAYSDRPLWQRVGDLAAGLLLWVAVICGGLVATLMVGFPGRSDCVDRCRTLVDAGTVLMWSATIVVELAVLALMVRAWLGRRAVSVWPARSIPVLAAMAVLSLLLVIWGLASAGQ
ncbi:hypothetical protein [Nocardia fluminea]|uniref:hypothetical protein n=1 Tax=Nocardia fluminea TaxID=134984 RepID=UPI003446DB4F